MTLRESLGPDVTRVYEQVDAVLNSEDGIVMLFDGDRMVSYTQGFGVSPCQLELLSVHLDRSVRNVVGGQSTSRRRQRRHREHNVEAGDRGRAAGRRQHRDRAERRDHRSLVDSRGHGVTTGHSTNGNRGAAAGRVLRLASETALTEFVTSATSTEE
jgi:hypothetical protein